MQRATVVRQAGSWVVTEKRDRITLGYEDRYRRRVRLVTDGGTEFMLDLQEATVMRHGDALGLEGGGVVEVIAAAEPLVEVAAGDAATLARLAWHLGNRHLPAQIEGERILIRDDHVIVDMLRGLGAEVRHIEAPFDPEGGAYGQHNHDHRHPHGHAHDQRHGHGH